MPRKLAAHSPSPPIPPISRKDVISGVATLVKWWVGNRRKKLLELRHDTHAVNPLLLPIIMNMHGFSSFRDLAAFMLAGHLVEGHATGFGKLIDEKVLGLFGTQKLDKAFRRENPEFTRHEYDNVDHLVPRPGAPPDLLSLKAGKWSIQLGQAVQLNRSFQVVVERRNAGHVNYGRLVVGVFYGTAESLTDKYSIICGAKTTGAKHDVSDLTEHIDILAGRPFWTWLNAGEAQTQDWILDGIIQGFEAAVREYGPLTEPFDEFITSFADTFSRHIDRRGKVDWHGLLKEING